jgi:gamma-glutamyltranspeptidase/glutathione hydrolase
MASFHVEPEEPVSTTFHGMTVYKPGFWSQGPSMIETLNILENFDLTAMKVNTTDYIHTIVEALKLAYADRDTFYGDPRFNKIPMERLLSKEYGAERAKLIGPTASMAFRPGDVEPNPPKHPSLSDQVVHEPQPHLPKDTTCVDAIDKDGIAISITPSGGWAPAVVAGDTGLELSERIESFLLIPGNPNELAPGKRPRITLSPTLVTGPGNTIMTFSTPGGDNQEQALLQVFFNAALFGYNAERAVEAPRFQTEHLVESFDNHPMKAGSLLLEDRTTPEVAEALKARGHKIEIAGRGNGSAPVFIRLLPTGVIEAGADPAYFRSSRAW